MVIYRFGPGVEIKRGKEGIVVSSRQSGKEFQIKRASPLLQFVEKLSKEGGDEEALASLIRPEALAQFYYLFGQLKKHGFLSLTCMHKKKHLFTLFPLKEFEAADLSSGKLKLSKFSLLRADGEKTLLENPLFAGHGVVHAPEVVALLHALAIPKTVKQLGKTFQPDFLQKILPLLIAAKMVCRDAKEEETPTHIQWEFHDLLFHTRTRTGRHTNPYGGLYPFKGKIASPPVCKPLSSSHTLPLPRPNLELLKKKDLPFTQVLEKRKSIRQQGQAPISLEKLGEFLFRAARLKEMRTEDLSMRPYPGGGAIYELEIYPVISAAQGVEAGLYHYDPKEHRLSKVDADPHKVENLLTDAKHSTSAQAVPQVLIVLTARFQRMSWKYRSMAYATTLKNTGVLLQTMYLVATAMDLAPCAIGGGNADLFSELIGSNYLEETSIGEFMLGSL